MARFGDGLAVGADLVAAAERASAAALAPLGDRVPDLVCTFVCANDPEQAVAAGVRVAQVSGAAATVGCTAGGVIGGGRGVEARSAVSVWAASLPGVRARTFHLEVLQTDSATAVVGLPQGEQDDVAVVLADPFSFPAARFVQQSNITLPGLPIVGGMASGPAGAGSTRLWVDGRAVDRGAVGVLLAGMPVHTVVSQGCRPIGPAMTVTGARGNVLTSLAGAPAVQRIQQVLAELPTAEQALASAGLHLGIAMDEYADEHRHGDFLVRGILGVDPDSGGLVVGDLVEVGRTVRLHVRDAETATGDLHTLLSRFRADTQDAAVGGALLFSCNGRGAHLFGSSYGGADHDPTVVREELGPLGVAGFFAAGELGPVAGRNHLHAFTASLLAFPA
jgi:small ligand-binding sensory domain FIST